MMAGEGGYAMRFNALSLFILNINLEGLCQIQAKCSALYSNSLIQSLFLICWRGIHAKRIREDWDNKREFFGSDFDKFFIKDSLIKSLTFRRVEVLMIKSQSRLNNYNLIILKSNISKC